MARPVWKGPYFSLTLYKAIQQSFAATATANVPPSSTNVPPSSSNVPPSLASQSLPVNNTTPTPVITYARNSTIIPAFIGAKLLIHDGKGFQPLTVREEMVGHKVGEFAPTKKQFTYRATNAHKRTISPK